MRVQCDFDEGDNEDDDDVIIKPAFSQTKQFKASDPVTRKSFVIFLELRLVFNGVIPGGAKADLFTRERNGATESRGCMDRYCWWESNITLLFLFLK